MVKWRSLDIGKNREVFSNRNELDTHILGPQLRLGQTLSDKGLLAILSNLEGIKWQATEHSYPRAMSRPFATAFYQSRAWQLTRDSIIAEYHGICQCCYDKPALIVHHMVPLNPLNINDPAISLGRDNLIPVCLDCHNRIHGDSQATTAGLHFTDTGDLQPVEDEAYSDRLRELQDLARGGG